MRRRRGVNVNVGRRGPGLVGTMARTAVIAGTATATVGATKAVMGGGSKQAAQQQAAADQQAQQAYVAGQQDASRNNRPRLHRRAADDSFDQPAGFRSRSWPP